MTDKVLDLFIKDKELVETVKEIKEKIVNALNSWNDSAVIESAVSTHISSMIREEIGKEKYSKDGYYRRDKISSVVQNKMEEYINKVIAGTNFDVPISETKQLQRQIRLEFLGKIKDVELREEILTEVAGEVVRRIIVDKFGVEVE
jgi:hypothetical protein